MCLNFFLPHRYIELGTIETIEVILYESGNARKYSFTNVF